MAMCSYLLTVDTKDMLLENVAADRVTHLGNRADSALPAASTNAKASNAPAQFSALPMAAWPCGSFNARQYTFQTPTRTCGGGPAGVALGVD